MKTCDLCKTEKRLNYFHKNRHSKDGKAGVCKTCALAKSAKWREDHAEPEFRLPIEEFKATVSLQNWRCWNCGKSQKSKEFRSFKAYEPTRTLMCAPCLELNIRCDTEDRFEIRHQNFREWKAYKLLHPETKLTPLHALPEPSDAQPASAGQ